MAADPWAFGWTPLLTLIGFAITLGFGVAGFNTFKKWKRQLVEERETSKQQSKHSRSPMKSKYVFDNIRSPMSFEYEWDDMPKTPGKSEEARRRKGSFYAIARRIRLNKDFFERTFNLQPRCMAMFGKEAEDIFMLMHKARRAIEVSSQMLAWKTAQYEDREAPDQNAAFYEECRRDVWDVGDYQPEKDKVGKQLREFREKMEKMFQPVIGTEFQGTSSRN